MPPVRHRAPIPDLELVLGELYGALADSADFSRCMEILAVPLRSHINGVAHEDMPARFSRVDVTGNAAPNELAALAFEYSTRWAGGNEWLYRGLENILTHGVGDADDVVPEAELFAMPYYQLFLRRLDIRHGLGICVWQGGPGQVTVASFNRSAAEGPFGKDLVRFVSALRPHICNAYAIYRRTALLTDENRSLRATLDQAPIGTLVVDATCRIVQANAEAEKWLSADQGLRRSAGGRLTIEHFGQHKRLEAAVTELAAGLVLNRVILVVRPGRSAADGIALHLCALPDPGRRALSTRVIVFLCPLTGAVTERLALVILQSALSLTLAEARVVLALHVAHDIAGAAAALGVGLSTARTHLKHAFDKTGAHKQSELLALVERLLVVAPHGIASGAEGRSEDLLSP